MMRVRISWILGVVMLAETMFGQTTEPATQPAARDAAAIHADVKAAYKQLDQLVQPPLSFFDPAGRQALAKTEVVSIVRRLSDLTRERLAVGDITAATAERLLRRDRLWLALVGDAVAISELESATHWADMNQALAALSDLLLIAMSDHASDQAARIRDVEALEKLVRAHPESPAFFFALERIALSDLPRDTETRRRLISVLQIQQTDEARELARQAQSRLIAADP